MCLTVQKDKLFCIAEKDIKVYKVVKRNCFGEYITPFRNAKVTFDEVLQTKFSFSQENSRTFDVDEGFHSFLTKKDAVALVTLWNFKDYKIAQCIIPKGSAYYEGEFQGDLTLLSRASNQIKYLKIIG